MKRSFVFLAAALIAFSCNKEADDFIWERSFGPGTAYFVKSSSDSGIVSCGSLNGSPYLLKLGKNKTTAVEYSSARSGLFTSVWIDKSRFIAGGSSNGNMLLACIGGTGELIWDTTLQAGFRIRTTGLVYNEDGTLTAVGTAWPDSVEAGTSGLLFVRFDPSGTVTGTKEAEESNFVAAGKITADSDGNILMPLTRKTLYSKPRASVAKYSDEFNKLWETELYNNSNFGAAGRGILTGSTGDVYVAGNTELTAADSILNTSFLAAITSSGTVRWKLYLEKTNSGRAIIQDENGLLMMLNANCFIVNTADPVDGTDMGTIRMFEVCNSRLTDAFGEDFDLNYDGSIIVAGSKGGNYYLALESIVQ